MAVTAGNRRDNAATYHGRMPDSTEPDMHELAAEGAVWTVGHSTHSFAAFLAILQDHAIETVADVRRFPGSRRHPQFGADALSSSLASQGIEYRWFPELGGRRRPDPVNHEGTAWRHPSFRAYAQHLQSEEFAQGLHSLLHVAKASRTAVMCSELLWWRCHRRLIADVMVLCGWRVTHILGATELVPHRLAAPARIEPEGLTYIAPAADDVTGCC